MGCTQTSRFDHFSSLSASWGLCIHTAFFYLVVAFYSLPEDMAIPFPKSHSFVHHHVMHHKYVCLCLFFRLLLISSLIFFFTSFFFPYMKIYEKYISRYNACALTYGCRGYPEFRADMTCKEHVSFLILLRFNVITNSA